MPWKTEKNCIHLILEWKQPIDYVILMIIMTSTVTAAWLCTVTLHCNLYSVITPYLQTQPLCSILPWQYINGVCRLSWVLFYLSTNLRTPSRESHWQKETWKQTKSFYLNVDKVLCRKYPSMRSDSVIDHWYTDITFMVLTQFFSG